jgi:molecular chaperone GrpE
MNWRDMSETEDKQKTEAGQKASETQETNEGQKEEPDHFAYDELNEDELREEIRKRDSELVELRNELGKANDIRLRKAAELDNYRKRVQKERSKTYEAAKARALEGFLSINDDLTRTLEASQELDVNQTFLEGVQLVAGKFQDVLKQDGVERIDEKGVPFDVDLHDALMRKKPDDESVPPDTVLQVVESGYKIGDRTIRHAKVIVSE